MKKLGIKLSRDNRIKYGIANQEKYNNILLFW